MGIPWDTTLIVLIIFGQTGQTPFSDRPNSEKCRAKFREKDSPRGWRISEQAESLTNHPSECRPEPTKCEFIRWTEHPLLISFNSFDGARGGTRHGFDTPKVAKPETAESCQMSAAAWEVLKTRANHLRCARVAALVRRRVGVFRKFLCQVSLVGIDPYRS